VPELKVALECFLSRTPSGLRLIGIPSHWDFVPNPAGGNDSPPSLLSNGKKERLELNIFNQWRFQNIHSSLQLGPQS